MMNDSVRKLAAINAKIEKLEKSFKRGVAPYIGFTIDVSFGGNKEIDVGRISIGSVSSEEKLGKEFLDLITKSLKDSRDFWVKQIENEQKEIDDILSITKAKRLKEIEENQPK